MNVCITTWHMPTAERVAVVTTFYVYGPTVNEYLKEFPLGWFDKTRGALINVKEAKQHREKGPRYRREDDRPSKFFFNEHLGREKILGGNGENTGERCERTAGEIYDEQMGEIPGAPDGRHTDTDGDVR